MHVVFLQARLPLTKTFVMTNGALVASPYPQVARVTSHHETADTLADLHALIQRHAQRGHCLFNGQLKKPLQHESRAGMTVRQPREWIVFDFDRIDARTHADVVAHYLPPECQQISYIAQLSASMYRPDARRWSGHIFMLLKTPVDEQRLRQWFEALNFSTPALERGLSLSDSQQALHWPLDRTVASSSKLIFIAPPRCCGFIPETKESIVLVAKRRASLELPAFTPIDTQTIRAKLNQLRQDVGLPAISYATTPFEDAEVFIETLECTVHDLKTSGDHYIRFNLNGGDSFAYFIDLRRPELIRNFKGEPYLKTEDAAPELWKTLRKTAPRIVNGAPLDEGTDILAFYATNQGSAVKIGTYSAVVNRLELNDANERAARAWLTEYGIAQPGFLPHMHLVFDPTLDVQYVTGAVQINTFQATAYMKTARSTDRRATLSDIPPVIDKTLRSMLGTPTPEIYGHFVNWLAFVFQTRRKTGIAWVLSGRTGTGKGVFVKHVLTPIFGAQHVKIVQFGLLSAEYNAFLENSLFVVFDETDTRAVQNQAALMAKLKMWITDSPLPIRRMRTDAFMAENYSNFLLLSNEKTPVVVTNDDRRFNLAERQTQRLVYTPNELKILFSGSELEAFADVLQRWPLDEAMVARTVETEARADVHEATTSINQLIAEAIQAGDLQFFVDRTPSDAESAADFFSRFNPIGLFKALIDEAIEFARLGRPMVLREEKLFVLFRTLIPDTRYFQDSKTWRRRHYKSLGLEINKRQRVPGEWDARERGVLVTWQLPDSMEPARADNVTPLNTPRKKKP